MTRNQRLALITTVNQDKERRRRRLREKQIRKVYPRKGMGR